MVLLRSRGDLAKTSFSFKASLPPPGPRSKGLGMEVLWYDKDSGAGKHNVRRFLMEALTIVFVEIRKRFLQGEENKH